MEQQPISLYRTVDVRGMDKHAIETLGVDGYLLMTRAAQASLDTLRREFTDARSLLVVCGSGNNAGDGYVLARLAVDAGLRVTVLAVTPPHELKRTARRAWQDFVGHGGRVDPFDGATAFRADVLVDALLGTGLDREVRGDYLRAIRWMNQATAPIVSLDVPSGLDSDSGWPRPEAVEASVTPTFIAAKIGLYTGRASTFCGSISIHDLELPLNVVKRFTPVARLLSNSDVRRCLPRRKRDAHKGVHGRVLIVGGNIGMSGAVVLAASAALRSGAGTVTVACHPHNREIVAGSMAEVMCVGVEGIDALKVLLSGSDVVAIGPGLGRDEWGRKLLKHVIQSDLPVVIDADGLRLVAEMGGLPKAGARIFTPHPGEAAALAGTTSAFVQENRLETAQLIARKYGAVIALKGAGTVVAGRERQAATLAEMNVGDGGAQVAMSNAAIVGDGVEQEAMSTAAIVGDGAEQEAMSTAAIVGDGVEQKAMSTAAIVGGGAGQEAKSAGVIVVDGSEQQGLPSGMIAEHGNNHGAKRVEAIVENGVGELAICSLGNPGMATAGSGDVLTGIVAGIWAQQPDRDSCAFEVTCAAVYVHAEAGDEAAKDGERGLIASDLLAQVRQCVNIKP